MWGNQKLEKLCRKQNKKLKFESMNAKQFLFGIYRRGRGPGGFKPSFPIPTSLMG